MIVPKFAFVWAACVLRVDLVSCPKHPPEVTAKLGQDATLQCRNPRGADITLIVWKRPDLESDQYVFLFRDDEPGESFQLPSYRGRVELRDPEMKDGDASVVLKNVNINDAGTYECRVSAAGRESDTPEVFSTIRLTVTDPGLTAGHTEEGGNKEGGNKEGGDKDILLGLSVIVVLVGFIGFLIYRKYKDPWRIVYTNLLLTQ